MDTARGLQLIDLFLDPAHTARLSDLELSRLAQEMSHITGHPAPTDVIFHTFFEEDLADGLQLTSAFLLAFMVRTAERARRYGG